MKLNKEKKMAKHSVKEECTCTKLCPLKISHSRRVEINRLFNELDAKEQKFYIRAQTILSISADKPTRRNEHFLYNDVNDREIVCQKFFFATLGFSPSNTTFLRNALSAEFPNEDRRGKHIRDNQLTESNVIEHIMSFNPQVSHHRREHAPNRLYLPSDVTIAIMHSFFNESYREKTCSYDYYRKTVEKMNISFTKLGHERCEDCEKYLQHQALCSGETNCQICVDHIDHKQRYGRARIEYESDRSKPFNPKHYICFHRSTKSCDVASYRTVQRSSFCKPVTRFQPNICSTWQHETYSSVRLYMARWNRRKKKGRSDQLLPCFFCETPGCHRDHNLVRQLHCTEQMLGIIFIFGVYRQFVRDLCAQNYLQVSSKRRHVHVC